jgi:hypothetical protein
LLAIATKAPPIAEARAPTGIFKNGAAEVPTLSCAHEIVNDIVRKRIVFLIIIYPVSIFFRINGVLEFWNIGFLHQFSIFLLLQILFFILFHKLL